MIQMIVLGILLAPWWVAMAAPSATNLMLMIGPSSMPIAAGQATLTIGMLQRANGVYWGDYKVTVSPYFFKNEHGRLAITVSDETLARLRRGQGAAVIGTATSSGTSGATRHVDATAMPSSNDRGVLKLWFMAGDRKMVFEPAYHFGDNAKGAVPAPKTEINRASRSLRRIPISHRAALDIADQRPGDP
jgi:hypothetical protein